MFILNKYYYIYFRLCSQNTLIEGYTESHHIIPKSLGGSNEKENLVKLTPKQHYIAHRLLTKITTGENLIKMKKALYLFCIKQPKRLETRYLPPSRVIKDSREALKANLSENHKAKISKSLKKYTRSKEHEKNLSESVSYSNKTRDISKWRSKLSTWKGKSRPDHSRKLKARWIKGKDLTVYTFIKNNIEFKGTRVELISQFPEDSISNSELGVMIRGGYKSHRGWKIKPQ